MARILKGARRFSVHICVISLSVPFAFARNLDQSYEKARFKVGEKSFTAYIADTNDRRTQGLMFIEKLDADTGMLFVFEETQPLSFWMKNTLIPLSIGFFDAKGKLVDIQEMKPASSMDLRPPSYQSREEGMFALEMNSRWFTRNSISKGARLRLTSATKSSLLKEKLPAYSGQ